MARMESAAFGRLAVCTAAAILCALSYLTLVPGWRYATVVPDLLAGRSLTGPEWSRTAFGVEFATEDGFAVVRLAADPRGVPALALRLPVPGDVDALRAAVQLKTQGMRPGPEGWQKGRAQVASYDVAGRYLWYWPNDVATLSGNSDWLGFDAVIPTSADLKAVFLVVYNGALSGVMSTRAVRVSGLKERPAFTVLRYALIAAWMLAGLWLGRAFLRRGGMTAAKALVLGLSFVALAGTLLPQPAFQRTSAPAEALLRSWLSPEGEGTRVADRDLAGSARAAPSAAAASPGAPARSTLVEADSSRLGFKELGHFAVFALLSLAAFMAYPAVPGGVRLMYLAVFALATESLQLFVVTRSARLSDLAVDLSAIVLVGGAIALLRRIRAAARARSARDAPPGARP